MLAYGIGVRQLATRIALYSDAKEAMSAEVAPGMPLGSDAPGAPAVDPPIAAGQVGAAGAVGGGVGVGVSLTATGVLVKVRSVEPELAAVALSDVPLDVAAPVEDGDDAKDDVDVDVDPDEVAGCAPVSTAAIADLFSTEFDSAGAELAAANVTPVACEMDGIDDPVP
jgi:hypothetical protein